MNDRPAPSARTLAIAARDRRGLTAAALLGAGALGATIALMGTSAWLISRAAGHPPEASLTLAIVGVQFFGLSRGFLRYGERLVGHDTALRTLADLRVRVFERLERLAPTGLPVFRRGDLVSRFVGDVDTLQDVVLRVAQPYLVAALVGVGTVTVLWLFLPSAGLVLLLALTASAVLVPWLTGRLARGADAAQSSARGALAAEMVDLVEGAAELAVLNAAPGQLARIERADERLRRSAHRRAATAGVGLGLTTALAGLASWGALMLGVVAVEQGHLDGALLAVLALVPLAAFELVAPLPVATQSFAQCRVAAGRVFAALDAEPAVSEPPEGGLTLPSRTDGEHELVLRDVWARYPGTSRAALRGVNLDLRPGRRVALVGPSGAGKSTLADVAVRFLPAVEGDITLDGMSVERCQADDVRCIVGLVEQHAHMFDTTLGENLRIGWRSATDADLEAVLVRVGLGDWLAQLPERLRTEVGPDGAVLSAGQRQRVAVARAMLADFPILILDEPAEHLDSNAADALTADLLTLTEGRSILLITHRLLGLDAVDEIVVLDAGRVVERGTHAELLDAAGRYAALWWEERLADRPGPPPDSPPVDKWSHRP